MTLPEEMFEGLEDKKVKCSYCGITLGQFLLFKKLLRRYFGENGFLLAVKRPRHSASAISCPSVLLILRIKRGATAFISS